MTEYTWITVKDLADKGWRGNTPIESLWESEICRAFAEDGDLSISFFEEQPPLCELTDEKTRQSLWVQGTPGPELARWLLRQYAEFLVSTDLGRGEYLLELDGGNLVNTESGEIRSLR